MGEKSPGVTLAEAVGVLRTCERRIAADLTAKRFRYAATMLGMAPGRKGATQLYDVADLALVRLLLRLEAEGLTRVVARWTVLYVAREVRELIEREAADRYVLVVPMAASYPTVRRGGLMLATDAAGVRGVQVPLKGVVAGLADAVARVNARTPSVWQWRQVERSSTTSHRVVDEEPDRRLVFYTLPA